VLRDGPTSEKLSLDRYDLIRGQQKDSQPASNLLVPLKDAPVLPPMRPTPAATPAPAPAATPASGASGG
jgi:general secretion pathway protein D